MFFKPQPVHFVGIGGIGMSGLAEILLEMGYPVSGSDLRASSVTEGLAQRGAAIHLGHQAANLGAARAVVVSSAVPAGNPEIVEARRLGLPIIPRGELLAELMRLKFGIAVAGSHGKTTTTSMIAAIMTHAGLDPTVVVGGKVGMMGGANARLGKSEYLVVESDESDGSFLKLAPILAVVTNIDREHLDHYADLDRIRDAFAAFIGKLPFYGAAILCLDDENVQRLLPSLNRRIDHLRHRGPGRSARDPFRRRSHGQPVSAHLPRRGAGLFPPARAGRAQRAERRRRRGHRTGAGNPGRANSRGPGALHRRRPALRNSRRGARRHRDRRLRPSSHRDPRHAVGRASL